METNCIRYSVGEIKTSMGGLCLRMLSYGHSQKDESERSEMEFVMLCFDQNERNDSAHQRISQSVCQ